MGDFSVFTCTCHFFVVILRASTFCTRQPAISRGFRRNGSSRWDHISRKIYHGNKKIGRCLAQKMHISNAIIHKQQNTSLLCYTFFKCFFLHMSAKSSNFALDFET